MASREDRKGRVKNAEILFNSKEFEAAHIKFSELLQDYPSDPIILNYIALLDFKKGKVKKAVNGLKLSIFNNPEYIDANFNLGLIFHHESQFEDAIYYLVKVLRMAPKYGKTYFLLAKIFSSQGKYIEAIGGYCRGLKIAPKYADGYFELAILFKKCRKFADSIWAYEKYLELCPNSAEAYNNLGNVCKLAGNNNRAIEAYGKAISINPDIDNAKHFLAVLTNDISDHAPSGYIKRFFNSYANHFEEHLVQNLGYNTPTLFLDEIKKLKSKNNIYNMVIDLGCGTGLSGELFRPLAKTLIGVDLSSNMLSIAKQKNIYDNLLEGEIVEKLSQINKKFDLFICADVIVYFGELYSLFREIKNHSRPGSLFIFSTENLELGEYTLNSEGRYSHNPDYIVSLAKILGFTVLRNTKINLRLEKGYWIKGGLFIFQYD